METTVTDPSLTIKFYERTPEQQAALGYVADSGQSVEAEESTVRAVDSSASEFRGEPHGSIGARAGHRAIAQSNNAEMAGALFRYSAPEEVVTFPSTCGACASKCETRIPYFQQVIVMASTCEACGYRYYELKPGGSISDEGKKVTVQVKNIKDLSRDVIKGCDSIPAEIPEI